MSKKREAASGRGAKGVDPSFKLRGLDAGFLLSRLSSGNQSRLADQVRKHVAAGEYKSIAALKLDHRDYDCANCFAADYLLCNFVKKFQDFDLGVNREQAAFGKWLAAEESCLHSNFFFRELMSGGNPFPSRVVEVLHLAQRKVHQILGEVSWGEIRKNCRFGPGSDLSTDGQYTSSYNKYRTPGSATPWISPIFADLFSEDNREDFLHNAEFVKGNRLSFVPKTALIDRAICVEPRWNIFLQLGIGQSIVNKLQNYGLDLTDQGRNRELARLAHVFGLATVDLSSASDTVSKGLVLYLLPDDWSDLIFKSRSPFTLYKGVWRQLEKVSSMGNGYTFPLESLIFLSISEAVCDYLGVPRCVGVFGDDLVVPTDALSLLTEVLSYSGFSVNPDKSFGAGNFHESCGKDFFNGVNVRPFFIKKKVSSILDYMTLANQITEYAQRLPEVAKQLGLKKLRDEIVEAIPARARAFGPIGLAGVIHSSFDECRPNHAPHGWEGYLISGWVPVALRHMGNSYYGHLYSKLSDDVDSGNGFTVRNSIRWRRRDTYVPTYGDFCWV